MACLFQCRVSVDVDMLICLLLAISFAAGVVFCVVTVVAALYVW